MISLGIYSTVPLMSFTPGSTLWEFKVIMVQLYCTVVTAKVLYLVSFSNLLFLPNIDDYILNFLRINNVYLHVK